MERTLEAGIVAFEEMPCTLMLPVAQRGAVYWKEAWLSDGTETATG
jgi:hypothetical protein